MAVCVCFTDLFKRQDCVMYRRRFYSEQSTTLSTCIARNRSWSPRTSASCSCSLPEPEIVDRKWRRRCRAPPSDDGLNRCRRVRVRCRRTTVPSTRPFPARGAANRKWIDEKRTRSWKTVWKIWELRHCRWQPRRYRSLLKPPFLKRRFVIIGHSCKVANFPCPALYLQLTRVNRPL